jgi:5-oxoprolinase (ATP-hydrolysing)
MPVFVAADRPTFYVAARGHHADVGGVQPGSMPPFSKTLDEEGVLLDALPIMRGRVPGGRGPRRPGRGRWPARNPDQNIGDLKAQIAACQAGADAVPDDRDLRRRGRGPLHGPSCRQRRAVGPRASAAARRRPACRWTAAARSSSRSRSTQRQGTARLDFTGSSRPAASNFNAPSAIVDAAALYVFRTLVDDDIPLNAGCLEPLDDRRARRLDAGPAPRRPPWWPAMSRPASTWSTPSMRRSA